MGKFDLVVSSEKEVGIDKSEFYLNSSKVNPIQTDMQEQFATIYSSLINISMLLNKVVKKKFVKGTRIGIYKGWAKRTKGQAAIIDKLRTDVLKNYTEDLKSFSINSIDLQIAELEKKISSIADGR